MPYSKEELNAILGAASSDEMSFGNQSLEDSASDYVVSGTISAAASGAVGIANSVIGLGRSIGVTDADNFVERDVIGSIVGSETQEFYDRHKSGADLAGMIGATVATGAVATIGLRSLQVAGKLGGAYELATGMRNADLVLGSAAVRSAVVSATSGVETASLFSRSMVAAYAQGVKQVALENAVGIVTSSLLNNQNIMLNPEGADKDAISSTIDIVKDNVMSGWFVGGTALQGGFEVAKVFGHVSKAVNAKGIEAFDRIYSPVLGSLKSFVGLEAGDALVAAQKAKKFTLTDPDYLATLQDTTLAGHARRAQDTLDFVINQKLHEATSTISDPKIKGVVAKNMLALINDPNTDTIADKFTGNNLIGLISATQKNEMADFYSKTSAPVFMYELMGGNGQELQAHLLTQFTESFQTGAPWNSRESIQRFAESAADGMAAGVQSRTTIGAAIGPAQNYYGLIKKRILGVLDVAPMKDGLGVLNTGWYKAGDSIRDDIMDVINENRKASGLSEMTKKEYSMATMMHELGHMKNNAPKFMEAIVRASVQTPELVDEIYNLTKFQRGNSFKELGEVLGEDFSTAEKFRNFVGNLDTDMYQQMVDASSNPEWRMNKFAHMKEVMANSVGALMNPADREIASRYAPNMSKLLKEHGSIAMPWSDTRLFYNMRTGARNSSILPGAHDMGRSVMKNGRVIHTPYEGKEMEVFDYDVNIFGAGNVDELAPRPNYLQASAMWQAKANEDLWKVSGHIDKELNGVITVGALDLPAWERAIFQAHSKIDDLELVSAKIRVQDLNGKVGPSLSLADAEAELIGTKKVLRMQMAASGKFNEQEIGHILNIDDAPAMGSDAGEWLLSRVRKMDVPENIQMQYKPVDIVDESIKARSYAQFEINQQSAANVRNLVSAELLQGDINKFPIQAEELDKFTAITQASGTTGLLSSGKHDFGSLRSALGAIGKGVADARLARTTEIVKQAQKFITHFQASENIVDRGMLAMADNFIRRNKSILAKFDDGTYGIVPVRAIDDMSTDYKAALELPEDADVRAAIKGSMIPAKHKKLMQELGAMTPDSKMVGEFLEHHRNNNTGIVSAKNAIAKARGSVSDLDPDILYASPMDLKSTPHVAFVVPSDAMAGHDPRNFMVYGSTAQELEEKINSIHSTHGSKYRVVYGGKEGSDVALYKKLVGDYEKGQAFDEPFTDAAKFRTGSSAELKPNMDLQSSATLNRYINWTIRQHDYIVRSGVELKYADQVAYLQAMDRGARRTEQGLFGVRKKESIYKESLNLMMDVRSEGYESQQVYRRVNDFIGNAGSELISKTLGAVHDLTRPITQVEFDKLNAAMTKAGVEPPYKEFMEMLIASPDVTQNRQLTTLVRTGNNIVASLGLKLDAANSLLQVASAPVLALPILRTALAELPKGSPVKKALEELVSVRVPGTTLKEPSVMKLFGKATSNMFGATGKAKMADYVERGLVPDFMAEYLNVMDEMALSGGHSVSKVMESFDKAVKFGSKITGHMKAEAYTRFVVANAVEQIGEIRGLSKGEIHAAQINAIDQVHGIQRYANKPQLFNGVIGQAVGLYQSYTFNLLHNMGRFAAKGDRTNAAIMTGLQSSIFGLQGLPGFNAMNESLMRANGSYFDLYDASGADTDDSGLGSYLMYGAASHLLSTPLDLASRGATTPRNVLLVPTNAADLIAVQKFSEGVANIWNTGAMIAQGDVGVADGILHGLAHNGFNRPLQGLANMIRGYTDTKRGQVQFTNANHVNYDELEEYNLAAMTGRLLGVRPLKETMILNSKFRKDGYQLEMRRRTEDLGKSIKIALGAGAEITPEMINDYALKYQELGLPIEGFNSFWGRQLAAVTQKDLKVFQNTMSSDTPARRSTNAIRARVTTKPPWEDFDRPPPPVK